MGDIKVFGCYPRQHVRVVEQIADILNQASIQLWYDYLLLPGQHWRNELEHQIHENDFFMCFISPATIQSEWCCWEYAVAVKSKKRVIPVLIEPTQDMGEFSEIGEYQFLDLTHQAISTHNVAMLVRGITDIYYHRSDETTEIAYVMAHEPLIQPPKGKPDHLEQKIHAPERELMSYQDKQKMLENEIQSAIASGDVEEAYRKAATLKLLRSQPEPHLLVCSVAEMLGKHGADQGSSGNIEQAVDNLERSVGLHGSDSYARLLYHYRGKLAA